MEAKERPDEETHFATYREALESIGNRPIAIRTLDLGADKFFKTQAVLGETDTVVLHERNPMLGCRAIRYCLQNPEVLRQQIRAIVRASALGSVKLMLPMVSCREEVLQVRQVVNAVQEQLAEEDVPFDPDMPVGIMVEVPSVALTIESYCDICDFFSIGTNDLTQYVVAADRTNEHVADLYQPAHPAVLKLVKQVVGVGQSRNIPVSLCGEIAGDPTFVLFFLGIGLRRFSVSPPLVPEVKKLIRSADLAKSEDIADKALRMATAREVLAYLRNVTREFQPGWTFL
jgi:phosphotransferase system enzyme I (PtsI)